MLHLTNLSNSIAELGSNHNLRLLMALADLVCVHGCNFGDGCKFQCNCKGRGGCDAITGECTAGNSCNDAQPDSRYGWGSPGCLTGETTRLSDR